MQVNPVNAMYGQDVVLGLYAGFARRVPPIWGFLQHGWMPDLPFWEGERHSRHWPVLVYSTRNLEAAVEWGLERDRTVHAIGSPFLYALRMLTSDADAPRPPSSTSTIVYPTHGDGNDRLIAENAALAETIRDQYGPDVTICLHGHDHGVPAIRDAYLRLGLRVICHGNGAVSTFLLRQLTELRRHGRVVSNEVTTALLHGGALGLHMEIAGHVFEQVHPPVPQSEVRARQQARWPALFEGGVGGDAAVALARTELGWENVRAPEELARLLGWRGTTAVKAAVTAPAVTLRRRVQERRRP